MAIRIPLPQGRLHPVVRTVRYAAQVRVAADGEPQRLAKAFERELRRARTGRSPSATLPDEVRSVVAAHASQRGTPAPPEASAAQVRAVVAAEHAAPAKTSDARPAARVNTTIAPDGAVVAHARDAHAGAVRTTTTTMAHQPPRAIPVPTATPRTSHDAVPPHSGARAPFLASPPSAPVHGTATVRATAQVLPNETAVEVARPTMREARYEVPQQVAPTTPAIGAASNVTHASSGSVSPPPAAIFVSRDAARQPVTFEAARQPEQSAEHQVATPAEPTAISDHAPTASAPIDKISVAKFTERPTSQPEVTAPAAERSTGAAQDVRVIDAPAPQGHESVRVATVPQVAARSTTVVTADRVAQEEDITRAPASRSNEAVPVASAPQAATRTTTVANADRVAPEDGVTRAPAPQGNEAVHSTSAAQAAARTAVPPTSIQAGPSGPPQAPVVQQSTTSPAGGTIAEHPGTGVSVAAHTAHPPADAHAVATSHHPVAIASPQTAAIASPQTAAVASPQTAAVAAPQPPVIQRPVAHDPVAAHQPPSTQAQTEPPVPVLTGAQPQTPPRTAELPVPTTRAESESPAPTTPAQRDAPVWLHVEMGRSAQLERQPEVNLQLGSERRVALDQHTTAELRAAGQSHAENVSRAPSSTAPTTAPPAAAPVVANAEPVTLAGAVPPAVHGPAGLAAPATAPTSAGTTAPPIDRAALVAQLTQRLAAAQPNAPIAMALDPPELGRVMVRFVRRGREIEVRLDAERRDVAELLSRDLPRLEAALGRLREPVSVTVALDSATAGRREGGAAYAPVPDDRHTATHQPADLPAESRLRAPRPSPSSDTTPLLDVRT